MEHGRVAFVVAGWWSGIGFPSDFGGGWKDRIASVCDWLSLEGLHGGTVGLAQLAKPLTGR